MIRHRSCLDRLRADKLGVEIGLPILKEHVDHLTQVRVQLIHRFALRMGPRPARDVPCCEEAGILIALNDGGERARGQLR